MASEEGPRLLTTHVGSLPRPAALADLLIRKERGEAIEEGTLRAEMAKAVRAVVANQIAAGIDIINDGEQPRVGFQTYVPMRMTGFGGASQRPVPLDLAQFPELMARTFQIMPKVSKVSDAPQAVSEIAYDDLSEARGELALFAEAAGPRPAGRSFMTAPSPGIIATTMLNAFYDSHEAYVRALGREMAKEYRLIAEAGLTLQIDAPDLAMERSVLFQDRSLEDFLDIARLHVEVLNAALEGIPRDQVRLHCCWGNWEGPHTHDTPLADLLPVLYGAKVGALSLEFANPRHQHEVAAVADRPPPDGVRLIPGVIDTTTNYVEHPEVVARRLIEAARAVGDPGRIIAGCDCGFGTFAGWDIVVPSIVWAKLATLAEGARIASGRLFG